MLCSNFEGELFLYLLADIQFSLCYNIWSPHRRICLLQQGCPALAVCILSLVLLGFYLLSICTVLYMWYYLWGWREYLFVQELLARPNGDKKWKNKVRIYKGNYNFQSMSFSFLADSRTLFHFCRRCALLTGRENNKAPSGAVALTNLIVIRLQTGHRCFCSSNRQLVCQN